MKTPRLETEEMGLFERAVSAVKSTLERATCVVPKEIPVFREIVGAEQSNHAKEPLSLTRENHAWFIGKIPKKKSTRKNSIYSDEFFEASLKFLFENIAEGERAQIIMAPCLSKYFNGEEDRSMGLSESDAKDFIMKIVDKKFRKRKSDLEICSVEDLPLHKNLFDSLESAFEGGVLDPEKAFSGSDFWENSSRAAQPEDESQPDNSEKTPPTSLDISNILYQASKENVQLFQFFRHAVPGKTRHEYDDPPSPSDYYALAEVSIRLAEILNGKYIHGGADRQVKYDELISWIVSSANPEKGKPCKKRAILEGLEPLVEFFKGKKFEILHLDTAKNPCKLTRERTRARINILLTGLLSLAAVAGPIYGGNAISKWKKAENARQAEELMMGMVDKSLEGKCLTHEDCKWGLNPEGSFRNIMEECLTQISIRYGLSFEQVGELKSSFLVFVLKNEKRLTSIGDNSDRIVAFGDMFMRDPLTLMKLTEVGIKIPESYEHLSPYEDQIVEIANGVKQKAQISGTKRELTTCNPQSMLPAPCACKNFEDLGVFVGAGRGPYWGASQIGICETKGGDKIFIAGPVDSSPAISYREETLREIISSLHYELFYKKDPVLSTEQMEEEAKLYVEMRKKEAMAKIPEEIQTSLREICGRKTNFRLSNFDFSESSTDYYEGMRWVYTYVEPFTEEKWELYMTGDCGKFGGKVFCENFVMARKDGDKDFTFKRAIEFAQKFADVMDSLPHFKRECD